MPLRNRDDLVKVFGEDDSVKGIVTWGSSAQVVLEVIGDLDLLDQVKVCVPELLYPQPYKIERFVRSINRLLVIEMNYTGQLHHLLRSNLDLPKSTKVHARAGGRPFSKQELTNVIIELVQ